MRRKHHQPQVELQGSVSHCRHRAGANDRRNPGTSRVSAVRRPAALCAGTIVAPLTRRPHNWSCYTGASSTTLLLWCACQASSCHTCGASQPTWLPRRTYHKRRQAGYPCMLCGCAPPTPHPHTKALQQLTPLPLMIEARWSNTGCHSSGSRSRLRSSTTSSRSKHSSAASQSTTGPDDDLQAAWKQAGQ